MRMLRGESICAKAEKRSFRIETTNEFQSAKKKHASLIKSFRVWTEHFPLNTSAETNRKTD